MNKERLQELLDKYKYLKEAYKQRPALERPPHAEWWDNEFEAQWLDLVERAVRYDELEEENQKLKEELKEKQQYYSELEVFAKEHWFDFWAIDC